MKIPSTIAQYVDLPPVATSATYSFHIQLVKLGGASGARAPTLLHPPQRKESL